MGRTINITREHDMLIVRELVDDTRLLFKATYTHETGRTYSAYNSKAFDAAIEAYKIANAIEKWKEARNSGLN